MNFVLQTTVDAINLGSIYGMSALGIGLLFGVLRVINFAHGDFISIGAYCLILPSTQALAVMTIGALPWPLMVVATSCVVMVLALLSDFLVFRPLRTARAGTVMIASFSLGYLIQHIILMLYGSRPKAINLWSGLSMPVELLGIRIPQIQLATIAVTAVLMIVLATILKMTSSGVEMRAASEDFQMSRFLGVRANRVIALAVAISGLLAAVVSYLFVAQTGILSYRMGVPLMLFGFIATVIGGMGSLFGAALGGFTVGVASVVFQALLPEVLRPFRDAFVFAVVILILLVRPQGLIQVRALKGRI